AMSEAITSPPPGWAFAAPAPRRGRPLVAWLVVLLAATALLWPRRESAEQRGRAAVEMMDAQGRVLVGFPALFGKAGGDMLQPAKAMEKGTYGQRLRFVVLAGELGGPKEGRAALGRLEALARAAGYEPGAKEAKTTELLERLYAEGGAAPLTEDEQDWLHDELRWFG